MTDISYREDLVHDSGPTEIRTRIAGFEVQSVNHYTIGPGGYLHSFSVPFLKTLYRGRR